MHPATYISARFVPFLNGSVPGQGHWVKPHKHSGIVRLAHGIIYLSSNIGRWKPTSYAKELQKKENNDKRNVTEKFEV